MMNNVLTSIPEGKDYWASLRSNLVGQVHEDSGLKSR